MAEVKFTTGTDTQYDNLETKDAGTLYYINNTTRKSQDTYLGSQMVGRADNSIKAEGRILYGTFEQKYEPIQQSETSYLCAIYFTPFNPIPDLPEDHGILLAGKLTEPNPLPSGTYLGGGSAEIRVIIGGNPNTYRRYAYRGMKSTGYLPNMYYLFDRNGVDQYANNIIELSNSKVEWFGDSRRPSFIWWIDTSAEPTISAGTATYNMSGDIWSQVGFESGIIGVKFDHGNGGAAYTYLSNYATKTYGNISIQCNNVSWNDGDTVLLHCVDTDVVGSTYIVYMDAINASATSAKSGVVRLTGAISDLAAGYAFGGTTARTFITDTLGATLWTANTSYDVGDFVLYTRNGGSKLYVCITANSDARFTSSKWKLVKLHDMYNSTLLASTMESGTITISNIPASDTAFSSVMFPTELANANYQVIVTNSEDLDTLVAVTSKTTTGFVITAMNLTDSVIASRTYDYIVLNT